MRVDNFGQEEWTKLMASGLGADETTSFIEVVVRLMDGVTHVFKLKRDSSWRGNVGKESFGRKTFNDVVTIDVRLGENGSMFTAYDKSDGWDQNKDVAFRVFEFLAYFHNMHSNREMEYINEVFPRFASYVRGAPYFMKQQESTEREVRRDQKLRATQRKRIKQASARDIEKAVQDMDGDDVFVGTSMHLSPMALMPYLVVCARRNATGSLPDIHACVEKLIQDFKRETDNAITACLANIGIRKDESERYALHEYDSISEMEDAMLLMSLRNGVHPANIKAP
jgi:hypothetical protein